MSTSVLVIAEDFRQDQNILKPLVSAMLRHLDKTSVTLRICMTRCLGG